MKIRLLALVLLSGATCLGQTLDQSYSSASGGSTWGISGLHSRGQTFTVGMDGVLTGIDFLMTGMNSPELLHWDLRSTTGGLPTASNTVTLAAGTVAASDVPLTTSFYHFDLSAFGLSVSSGDVLAFTLFGTSGNTILSVPSSNNNGYAGGQGVDGVPGGATTSWSSLGTVDFGIQTYVATAVPEPATTTSALGAAAGLALLIARWRRRVARS